MKNKQCESSYPPPRLANMEGSTIYKEIFIGSYSRWKGNKIRHDSNFPAKKKTQFPGDLKDKLKVVEIKNFSERDYCINDDRKNCKKKSEKLERCGIPRKRLQTLHLSEQQWYLISFHIKTDWMDNRFINETLTIDTFKIIRSLIKDQRRDYRSYF